jgi:hypothetical protein
MVQADPLEHKARETKAATGNVQQAVKVMPWGGLLSLTPRQAKGQEKFRGAVLYPLRTHPMKRAAANVFQQMNPLYVYNLADMPNRYHFQKKVTI